MNLQRVNVKLFTDTAGRIDLDPFLHIFGRWREEKQHPARWVDLADYAHVPKGPGVLLIGKQGNLSIDLAEPGPGLMWANKEGLEGPDDERIVETFRRTLRLLTRLISEAEYPKTLEPRPGFWELSFNDRLETPNDDATERRLRPAVEAAVRRLFGAGATLIREADPERRYGFLIHIDSSIRLEDIAARAELAPT